MLEKRSGVINRRFLTLDSLRGLSAIAVFLFHCVLNSTYLKESPLRLGITGVDLFFMISGYVMLLTLERTSNWCAFVINRFFKLYPVYWVIVSFTFLLILLNTNAKITTQLIHEYLGNLTMIQRYFGVRNLDEQYWTLEVELAFYFFMLMVFIWDRLKFIETIGFLFLLFCLVFDVFLENKLPPNTYFILINHFPLFYSGIILYKIKNEKGSVLRYLILILCFAASCLLFNNGGRSMHYVSLKEYIPTLFFYFTIFLLAIYNRLTFLHLRPLLFMGRISYSFYLIHQYFSSQIIIPNLQKHIGLNFYLCIFIAFVACFLLASITTIYVEEPCVRLGKKFINRKEKSVVQ